MNHLGFISALKDLPLPLQGAQQSLAQKQFGKCALEETHQRLEVAICVSCKCV